MNPSTAQATAVVDELIRCGLREAVIAPGSRSAPLAMELHRRAAAGDLRLSVRIDERSAAFTALGLAKASRAPVAAVCTSGTAAAHFHAAVIEADESGVPLLVLTADRPPELRGTGANQTIDQLKLYGSAVRWFCELGVAEGWAESGAQDDAGEPGDAGEPAGAGGGGGQVRYWRSVIARAWGLASGAAGGPPGPVHVNMPLRDPLVPDLPGSRAARVTPGWLDGRPGGAPWTRFAAVADLHWAERGLVVLGDGDYDASPLLDLAWQAGWPVLAEPSSGGRRGECALPAYQYLLADSGFMAEHQPDVLVSAGRPGLSRGQLALLRSAAPARHVVVAQGPGRWSDPARSATDVTTHVRLAAAAGDRPAGGLAGGGWLTSWREADLAVREAVDAALDASAALSEPRLAREVAAALPDGALLWVASSLPVRDLDQHMAPRAGLRILASRGASGIDGLVSSAVGAALAHQSAGGGPAVALLGDLALLHDAPGLFIGPGEPRPDLCLIVVNNDGGGIFSQLEQAAFAESFERVFGTPHGADVSRLAAAAGLPYRQIERVNELTEELAAPLPRSRSGLRILELRTSRPDQASLRAGLTRVAAAAIAVQTGRR
jgi:2-succinyl-5-enolpyruvyl-6-hydroxy-3-cyclohexene-1-carboxylate synthase